MESINPNPFMSGLRAGQAMGQGIQNMMNGSSLENAMKRFQAGEDAGAIYQELLTSDPQAAQQFFQFIQMQQQGSQPQQGTQPMTVRPISSGAF